VKAETEALVARARQDLLAARHLLDKSFLPHAISDAYYAMFHAAKALLVEKGIETSSHRGVISSIGHDFVRMGLLSQTDGRRLRELFDQRQRADYKVTDQFDEAMAREAITWAEAFIESAERLLGEPGVP
jgi:uncharacterized protein